MTNVKPPDALSRASAIVNGLPDPLPLANAVTSQVSPAVAAVLSRGMSQKRDDRYASASAMSEAFRSISENSLGDAATVLIAGAANTDAGSAASKPATMIAGAHTTPMASEAQTLLGADATSVRNANSASETATLIHVAQRGTGSRKWVGAALLLILIVGGAGGFYAYRRRQSQQASAPTTENPVQAPVSNQPADGAKVDSVHVDPPKTDTKTDKKVESTQRASTSKAADKAGSNTPAKDTQPLPPTHDANREAQREAEREANREPKQGPPPFPSPQDPRFDPFRGSRHPGRPGAGAGQTPQVRTLPNGTRIVTQPDGTRIVTMPKGEVRVIPPGERPFRKRNRP
jgi:hypothetical protein